MWLSASDQERISRLPLYQMTGLIKNLSKVLVDCSNPDDFMFDSCVEDKAPNCQGDWKRSLLNINNGLLIMII